jgi:hypothetical protein
MGLIKLFVFRIFEPRSAQRPVATVTSASAQLSAALASPVAVRSKRKGQVKAALVTATSADLRFDFDAQGAEPFRILIRSADKHGICVFNLALSHRGHVPQPESQPTQPQPKRAHKAKQTDAVPAFEVLENEGVLAPAQRENGPVARGTVNPGNFCYANATLVALAHMTFGGGCVLASSAWPYFTCGSPVCTDNARFGEKQRRFGFGTVSSGSVAQC